MGKILTDTDVIIDFLRGHQERLKTFFDQIQNRKLKPFLSLISIVELYAGAKMAEKRRKDFLKEVLGYFEIISPDLIIAEKAGEIRREYSLSLADSLIAATSIIVNNPLLTFNQKHFRKIKEIKFYEIK